MLYLEDYIELIEQLPQDLRDRFTEMRELDLKVQNTIDTLDTRVRRFFSDSRKNKPDVIDEEYKNIHTTYKSTLDDADEKVTMASQIYDLVDRHLRKLDQELSRFKMELEADCSGITETLEKNVEKHCNYSDRISMDMFANFNSSNSNSGGEQKKRFGDIERLSSLTNGNDKSSTGYSSIYSSPLGASYPLVQPSPKTSLTSTLVSSVNTTTKHNGVAHSSSSSSSSTFTNPTKSLNLNDIKEEGRGAQASFKAMTAAQKKAEQLGNSLSMSGLLAPSTPKQPSSTPAAASSFIDVTSNSFMHSSTPPPSAHNIPSLALKQSALAARAPKSSRRNQKSLNTSLVAGERVEPSLDWVPDPNEPTYCLCNQVSYGEMVGCDNASCPIEWFHYGCVGLTDAPKGKWYCPDCAAQIKKKRVR